MSDYGNRAKKGDGVEVSKATVSAAKQQQEKQKCQVKKKIIKRCGINDIVSRNNKRLNMSGVR